MSNQQTHKEAIPKSEVQNERKDITKQTKTIILEKETLEKTCDFISMSLTVWIQ